MIGMENFSLLTKGGRRHSPCIEPKYRPKSRNSVPMSTTTERFTTSTVPLVEILAPEFRILAPKSWPTGPMTEILAPESQNSPPLTASSVPISASWGPNFRILGGFIPATKVIAKTLTIKFKI